MQVVLFIGSDLDVSTGTLLYLEEAHCRVRDVSAGICSRFCGRDADRSEYGKKMDVQKLERRTKHMSWRKRKHLKISIRARYEYLGDLVLMRLRLWMGAAVRDIRLAGSWSGPHDPCKAVKIPSRSTLRGKNMKFQYFDAEAFSSITVERSCIQQANWRCFEKLNKVKSSRERLANAYMGIW